MIAAGWWLCLLLLNSIKDFRIAFTFFRKVLEATGETIWGCSKTCRKDVYQPQSYLGSFSH